MLEEMHTENRFKSQMQSERTYRAMSQDISMLIMPEYSKDRYRFVYLKDKNVPAHIKAYNIIQDPGARQVLSKGHSF
jgi:hypothetical protein